MNKYTPLQSEVLSDHWNVPYLSYGPLGGPAPLAIDPGTPLALGKHKRALGGMVWLRSGSWITIWGPGKRVVHRTG